MKHETSERKMHVLQKLYRCLFWTGYLVVLITAFLPVTGELDKKYFGPESFHIRLDHLLHFTIYFLICIYYFAGQRNDIYLFSANSLVKFILLVLLLAIITELVQVWVPERAFNMFDLISNVGGIFVGLVVLGMAQRRKGTTA